jgi:hypothetical protein
MPKIISTIFICLALCSSLLGQGYIGYFSKTTTAEVQIVAGNHPEALGLYKEAFGTYEKSFSKDLHNAAVCAILNGEYPIAFQYLDSLIQQGIALKYFKSHPGLKPLRKTKQWKPWLASYPAKHHAFELRQRSADRKQLDEMERLDQEFRQKPGSYAVWRDTIKKIDTLNIQNFRKIVATSGYPSDREIGIKTPCDLPNHYVVLRHYYQNKRYDLSDVLYQAMVEGDLEPQFFSELEDKRYGNMRYSTLLYLKSRKWFVDLSSKFSDETIQVIDSNRTSIGLESLADYKEKVKFQVKNKLFCFKTYEGLAISYGMPLEKLGKPKRFSEL